MRISHEAIYQSLFIQGRGALKRELVACLRTGRALREPRARSRNKAQGHVTADVVLSERPAEAEDRAVPGHWEGDLIIGTGRSAIGYVSIAFTARLLDAGIDPSVGSVGDAYDNALAESTVGSFKTEQINRNGPWRDVGAVEVAAFEWVDFFNTLRPHEYLDDLTPLEAEKLHYDHVTALAQAG